MVISRVAVVKTPLLLEDFSDRECSLSCVLEVDGERSETLIFGCWDGVTGYGGWRFGVGGWLCRLGVRELGPADAEVRAEAGVCERFGGWSAIASV